jgi:Zn-dependent protease with chaperone function
MEYHAKLPDENPNVSHQNPIKEFFSLLAGVVGIVLFIYWILGFFIDSAVDYISPEMEIAIFESLGEEFISTNDVERSESFTQTEQQMRVLLDDLTKCMDVGYPIELIFQQSEQANAFAAPGGKMVVLSGLLKHVESENGLAFVIAHELGHFKNRDHLRGLGRGVVLMALSFLATGNMHLSKVLVPVNAFQNAQFSQSRESDADERALDIVQCHYGHVSGSTEFFSKISQPDADLPFTHYFRTHPEAQARVKAIKSLSQEKSYSEGIVKPVFWSRKRVH